MPVRRKRVIPVSDEYEPMQQPPTTLQPPKGPSNFLIIVLIIVSFFAGYLFFKVKSLEKAAPANPAIANPQQPPARPTSLSIQKPSSSEYIRGDKNARYMWVEYSDLECPFCKRIHPDMLKLTSEYKDKISWIFRHYPLPFHPKAQKSAEAVECAGDQKGSDGFWQMTDLIFEKMPDMELTSLPDLAGQLGLDSAAFKQCLDSGKFEKKVKDQLAEGNKAGVQATPTGVIYDMQTGKTVLIEGALPYDSLKQSLDTFLSANK